MKNGFLSPLNIPQVRRLVSIYAATYRVFQEGIQSNIPFFWKFVISIYDSLRQVLYTFYTKSLSNASLMRQLAAYLPDQTIQIEPIGKFERPSYRYLSQ